MKGNCKYCEYGYQYDDWCELKKIHHKAPNVKCDEYLEAGYLSDIEFCDKS